MVHLVAVRGVVMTQPDYSSLPQPPTSAGGRPRRGIGSTVLSPWLVLVLVPTLVVAVVLVLFVGAIIVTSETNAPGAFVCPTDVSSRWVNETRVGEAPSRTVPSQPPPGSAVGLAQSLTPSLVDVWEPPSEWTATPADDKATSSFSYYWGTSALGNTDSFGMRAGGVSVELYGSPEARLAAEQDQSIEAKRTGNTWVCFADCGPVLVGVKVMASKVSGVRGSDAFHNDDRIAMADLAMDAQLALNRIYGGCPVPEYVNKNKPE
jgi:hypothetical protein